MDSLRLEKYSPHHKVEWDTFIKESRNGIFLFERDYMDYHSDRFEDYSIIFYSGAKITGVFPANKTGNQIFSHQGLTFGGLIYGPECKALEIREMVKLIRAHFMGNGVKEIIVKPTPYFLHLIPSSEDLYFLHCLGAILFRRDLSSLVDLNKEYEYSKGRKWIINKAIKSGITIRETDDWAGFHEILTKVLSSHNVEPVHSLEEMIKLQSLFPQQIKLYGAYSLDSRLLAGSVTFRYRDVLHTQYLANSEEGRSLGALDLTISELIKMCRSESFRYLSFGVSTTSEGKILNEGLLQHKESFGGRGVLHDWYKIILE